jgi:hypothetical protein
MTTAATIRTPPQGYNYFLIDSMTMGDLLPMTSAINIKQFPTIQLPTRNVNLEAEKLPTQIALFIV